uniref:Uncharacterized protein n=1 Tax=Ciona savignyi TaxID=51511 RepID=H2YLC3_CIOSA
KRARCKEICSRPCVQNQTSPILILECAAKFAKSVEDYKTKVKAYIKKLADDFDERLAKRVADIAEYKKKLGERATAEKEKLKEAIFKAKLAHIKRYVDMLKMYHDGDTLPDDVTKMSVLYALQVDRLLQ